LPIYVPILISSEQIVLRHSIAERIASLLVLGLLESGTFSTSIFISPNFPLAIIWCVFLSVSGSATIFTNVLSLPNPTRLSNAETLMFFGNNFTASFALPSKIVVTWVSDSSLICDVSKKFCAF